MSPARKTTASNSAPPSASPSAPAASSAKAAVAAKPDTAKSSGKKPKLVRDSFTIPKHEFAAIDTLKARALAAGVSVKKSELLRAGLMVLSGMNDAALSQALAAVPTLKTGRPAAEVKVADKKPAAKKTVTKPAVVKKAATKATTKATPQPASRVPVRAPARKPAAKKA